MLNKKGSFLFTYTFSYHTTRQPDNQTTILPYYQTYGILIQIDYREKRG